MTTRIRGTDWPLGPLTPEDLPAGVYLVSYRTWERKSYFGQPKIRLEFVIIEPVAFAGFGRVALRHLQTGPEPAAIAAWKVLCALGPGSRQPAAARPAYDAEYIPGLLEVRVDWGHDKETGQPTTPMSQSCWNGWPVEGQHEQQLWCFRRQRLATRHF